MWLCFSDSFISAVQDRYDPDRLVVRARNPEHLKTLFPEHEAILTPDADYAARVFIRRDDFNRVVAQRINEIDYPNFKDSVSDRDLHMLYEEFWMLHFEYQAVKQVVLSSEAKQQYEELAKERGQRQKTYGTHLRPDKAK